MWFAGILTGSVFIADDLHSTDPEDCGCFKQGLHTVTLLSKQSTYRTYQFACERNATSMPVKEKGQDICGKDT